MNMSLVTCGTVDATGSLCAARGLVRRKDRNDVPCLTWPGGCTHDRCCRSWPSGAITCDFAARNFGVLIGNGSTPPLRCDVLAPSSTVRNPFASTCSTSPRGCRIDDCCSPPTCEAFWRTGKSLTSGQLVLGSRLCDPTYEGADAHPRSVPNLAANGSQCASAEKGCNFTECCIADPPRLGRLTCGYAEAHYGMVVPSAAHVKRAEFQAIRCKGEFSCDEMECYKTTCGSVAWHCNKSNPATYHFADPGDPYASLGAPSSAIECKPDAAYQNKTSTTCDADTCCRPRTSCHASGATQALCTRPRWTPKHPNDRPQWCDGPTCRAHECCDEWTPCPAATLAIRHRPGCLDVNQTAWCRNDTMHRDDFPYGCAAKTRWRNTSSACCLVTYPPGQPFHEALLEFLSKGVQFQSPAGSAVVYSVIGTILLLIACVLFVRFWAAPKELERTKKSLQERNDVNNEILRDARNQQEGEIMGVELYGSQAPIPQQRKIARSDYTIL